ncbi:MAG: antitoxin [Gaiellaceae bacterium]
MRTTVTLDPDTDAHVRRLMRERGLSFKEAVNQAIRAGVVRRPSGRKFTVARPLGPAKVDLTKALRLAGQLEDEALRQKLAERR